MSEQGGWHGAGTNAGEGRQRGPRVLAEQAGEARGVVLAHGGCAGGCCGVSQEAGCVDGRLMFGTGFLFPVRTQLVTLATQKTRMMSVTSYET